jgi:GNAT superfamily N-acetyltransferase
MTPPPKEPIAWSPRRATPDDIPAIAALIPISVRALQAPYYSPEQIEAALGPAFGVDRQLVQDKTYFVVEYAGAIVGCGGWSKRASLCGSGPGGGPGGPELDPSVDAARIRAFFVHPDWARRGIGRSLMAACETAISRTAFRSVVILSTLAGEPFYLGLGYRESGRSSFDLPGGLAIEVVTMEKALSGPVQAP